jgi:hypothetical protein
MDWPGRSIRSRILWLRLRIGGIASWAATQRGSAPGLLEMRPIKWTDERIEGELRALLGRRKRWPSHREFREQGHRALRDAITRHGGPRIWAKRMGIAYPAPAFDPRWTDRRVHAELGRFLAGRTTWPTRREFRAAGLSSLHGAVARLGGTRHWAARFGLPPPGRRWNEEQLEQALRPLVAQLGRWPTKGEFRRAGLATALSAVYSHGGVEHWRRRLGARMPPRPRGPLPNRQRRWTEPRIELELRAFCAERTTWPGWNEFLAAGRGGLYRAASAHSGIAHWRRKLELTPVQQVSIRRPRQPAQVGHPRWSEDRVEAELKHFLAGRSEWPAWSEFVAARRQPLREAASRYGDARYWANRIGVRYVERRGREPWTETRLRAGLEPFLAGRGEWPRPAEFVAAGRRQLWYAVTRLGGPERWAAEFGLPLPTPRSRATRGAQASTTRRRRT